MNDIPSGEDKISIVATEALNFLQGRLLPSIQYTLLDIGCGDGRDINHLSANFANLILGGIDVSSEAIEQAVHLNSGKENITFECMDWKELDDTKYDIVYMSGVYHFFPLADRRAFISKVKKILKPDGFFLMSTLSSNDTQYYGKGEPVVGDPNSFQGEYFIHFSSEEELREDFKFLRIVNLFEYFHKNYAHDAEYHTMWMLIGENVSEGFLSSQ
jgi:cyclopropane fatty-acyl-phospholipid synthase-like methyltransferase